MTGARGPELAEAVTVGMLWRRRDLTRALLDEAVVRYLENPSDPTLRIGAHYAVDVEAALSARPLSKRVLADPASAKSAQATALLNAIVQPRANIV